MGSVRRWDHPLLQEGIRDGAQCGAEEILRKEIGVYWRGPGGAGDLPRLASAHARPLVAMARIRTVLLWATGLELGLLGDF